SGNDAARECGELLDVRRQRADVIDPGEPRRVASHGMLRASFCLFPFPLGDRGQISVAVDSLLAHVFPATEQEYCESDRDQCAEDGAQRPVPCPVVAHHQLRSFGLRPTPVADRGSCGGMRAGAIAAALWRMAEAFN